jgi:hypothetical protein
MVASLVMKEILKDDLYKSGYVSIQAEKVVNQSNTNLATHWIQGSLANKDLAKILEYADVIEPAARQLIENRWHVLESRGEDLTRLKAVLDTASKTMGHSGLAALGYLRMPSLSGVKVSSPKPVAMMEMGFNGLEFIVMPGAVHLPAWLRSSPEGARFVAKIAQEFTLPQEMIEENKPVVEKIMKNFTEVETAEMENDKARELLESLVADRALELENMKELNSKYLEKAEKYRTERTEEWEDVEANIKRHKKEELREKMRTDFNTETVKQLVMMRRMLVAPRVQEEPPPKKMKTMQMLGMNVPVERSTGSGAAPGGRATGSTIQASLL